LSTLRVAKTVNVIVGLKENMNYIWLYILIALIAVPVLGAAISRLKLFYRGWTIKGVGRDALAYVEKDKGQIIFGAELSFGTPYKRVITIPKPSAFPGWATSRRDEIISRIKTELPESKYKYEEER